MIFLILRYIIAIFAIYYIYTSFKQNLKYILIYSLLVIITYILYRILPIIPLRLIFLYVIMIAVFYQLKNYPPMINCMCFEKSWWNTCIPQTQKGSEICVMSEDAVDFIISSTTEIVDEVAYDIKKFAVALATKVPTLPNPPSLKEIIIDKFPNINIPKISIPSVNFSCGFKNPINIVKEKMEIIKDKLTDGFSKVTDEFENIKNKLPSPDDFDKLFKKLGDDFKNVGNKVKEGIDSFPIVPEYKCPHDNWIDVNGTMCVAPPPANYEIRNLDIVSYWLTQSTSYPMGTGYEPSKSCPNGWRKDETSCWEDYKCHSWWDHALLKTSCDGCGCIKQSVNKDCHGGDLDALGALCYPGCRSGYHKKPGDVVSCWNDLPTSKLITEKGLKVPVCNGNRHLINLNTLCGK